MDVDGADSSRLEGNNNSGPAGPSFLSSDAAADATAPGLYLCENEMAAGLSPFTPNPLGGRDARQTFDDLVDRLGSGRGTPPQPGRWSWTLVPKVCVWGRGQLQYVFHHAWRSINCVWGGGFCLSR